MADNLILGHLRDRDAEFVAQPVIGRELPDFPPARYKQAVSPGAALLRSLDPLVDPGNFYFAEEYPEGITKDAGEDRLIDWYYEHFSPNIPDTFNVKIRTRTLGFGEYETTGREYGPDDDFIGRTYKMFSGSGYKWHIRRNSDADWYVKVYKNDKTARKYPNNVNREPKIGDLIGEYGAGGDNLSVNMPEDYLSLLCYYKPLVWQLMARVYPGGKLRPLMHIVNIGTVLRRLLPICSMYTLTLRKLHEEMRSSTIEENSEFRIWYRLFEETAGSVNSYLESIFGVLMGPATVRVDSVKRVRPRYFTSAGAACMDYFYYTYNWGSILQNMLGTGLGNILTLINAFLGMTKVETIEMKVWGEDVTSFGSIKNAGAALPVWPAGDCARLVELALGAMQMFYSICFSNGSLDRQVEEILESRAEKGDDDGNFTQETVRRLCSRWIFGFEIPGDRNTPIIQPVVWRLVEYGLTESFKRHSERWDYNKASGVLREYLMWREANPQYKYMRLLEDTLGRFWLLSYLMNGCMQFCWDFEFRSNQPPNGAGTRCMANAVQYPLGDISPDLTENFILDLPI